MRKLYMIITRRIPKQWAVYMDNTIASPLWRERAGARIRRAIKRKWRMEGEKMNKKLLLKIIVEIIETILKHIKRRVLNEKKLEQNGA